MWSSRLYSSILLLALTLFSCNLTVRAFDEETDEYDVKARVVRISLINGEVTLKRFYHEGEHVRLQPANSMMSPIYASARDVAVQGVVVGLMRRF